MSVIQHRATVVKSTDTQATVLLMDTMSCEGCQLKSACGTSESKPKLFEIPVTQNTFQEGEKVLLTMQQNTGLLAVLLAYVIPFVILITLLIVSAQRISEWLSGLLVLVFIALYFLFLKWTNPLISKMFQIKIDKMYSTEIV